MVHAEFTPASRCDFHCSTILRPLASRVSPPVLGRTLLHGPRSASRASASTLSPGTKRADVVGKSGTDVVPRGSGSARESQLFSGYVMTKAFRKFRSDITTSRRRPMGIIYQDWWYAELCQHGAGAAGKKNTREKTPRTHGHTHEQIHPVTPYSRSTTAVCSTAVVSHSTLRKNTSNNNSRTHNDVCTIIVQQQYRSTAENTRNHARNGPVWRFLPLLLSKLPARRVRTQKMCTAVCMIQQHMRWYRV